MPKHIPIVIIESWCGVFKNKITVDQISEAVLQVFSIHPLDLTDACRNGLLTDARACLVWYARNATSATLMQLGDLLDREHTSIINLKRKADGLLNAGDEAFSDSIRKIHAKLEALV